MRIAVIGTRNPSEEVAGFCREVCMNLRDLGWDLVTGNADGVDSIARDVWNEVDPKRVTLFLPWPSYNRDKVAVGNKVVTYNGQATWKESVKKYHPAAGKLTPGTFKLHARNYGIIEAADMVVAFPRADRRGGTEQGIRVARALNKSLYILPDDLGKLQDSIGAGQGLNAGKIILCSINSLDVTADIKLFIARVKPKGIQGWIHVPQLAPSAKLFNQYIFWRRQGLWPGKWETYKRQFVTEMKVMDNYLARVEQRLNEGKDVALACYCKQVNYCHRKLVGDYFKNKGYKVIYN